MSTPILWWVLFNLFLLGMLALDLGVFHRKAHEVRVREALVWTGVWFALAMAFNVGIYFWMGSQRAVEFLTGYLIEKALAVDNIFVFVMIFSYFQVPPRYQHKVLFWGVLGALIMRAGFIFAGVELIHRFHGMIYVFGGLLILTGLKMLWTKGQEIEPEQNPVLRLVRRLVPVADRDEQGRFFVRSGSRWMATPLFLVLVLVEVSDLIFAVDSIPAILAITLDPFIVYTSNALAILGLRSLYFALAGLVEKFVYLHYGLAAILVFVGTKMLLADVYKLPTTVSLGVIVAILASAVLASLVGQPRGADRDGRSK
jgi:tellurite resistance protein TerC